MQLVGDVGGTKSSWMWKDHSGGVRQVRLGPFHPLMHGPEDLFSLFSDSVVWDYRSDIKVVYYYGTACNTAASIRTVTEQLGRVFAQATIEVYSDILGAARAASGDQASISCILGTGSSSCVYDGHQIVERIPSLGYLLADDGSGADLGRELIRAYYFGLLSQTTMERLESFSSMHRDQLLHTLYRHPSPNRQLASFVPFIVQQLDEEDIYVIVRGAFDRFIQYYIVPYAASKDYAVYFSGSVAWYLRRVMAEGLKNHNLQIGKFVRDPIVELYNYHHG